MFQTMQLLFPTADAQRPFSMLGLGDIVIPGITSILLWKLGAFIHLFAAIILSLFTNLLFIAPTMQVFLWHWHSALMSPEGSRASTSPAHLSGTQLVWV